MNYVYINSNNELQISKTKTAFILLKVEKQINNITIEKVNKIYSGDMESKIYDPENRLEKVAFDDDVLHKWDILD